MSDPDSEWELTFSDSGPVSTAQFSDLVYGDGKFLATGIAYGDIEVDPSTFYRTFVGVASSPDGAWTVNSWGNAGDNSISRVIRSVAFGDGIWVAILCTAAVTFVVYTATDPAGEWTERATLNSSSGPWAGGGEGGFEWRASVVYDGTTWGAQVNGRVFTTNDPTGSWTPGTDFWQTERIAFFGTQYPSNFRMFFVDGEWVMFFTRYPMVTAPVPIDGFRILTTDDPSGSWVERSTKSWPYSVEPYINLFKSHEGYVLSTATGVFLADTLDGPWTTKIDLVAEFPESANWAYRVVSADGYYVLTGSNGYEGVPILGVTTSLDLPFEFIDPANREDPTYFPLRSLKSNAVFGGGEWAIAGAIADPIGSAAIWTPGGGGTGWGLLL